MKTEEEISAEAVRILRVIDYKLLSEQKLMLLHMRDNVPDDSKDAKALDGIINLSDSLHDFNEDFLK